jgi:replicative DNA helicase
MNDINFGQLGANYQLSLLKLIIEDRKFSETIIEVIEPDYFDNSGMKFIVQNIKEYFETFGKTVPQYNAIEEQIKAESISDTNRKSNLDMLSNIKNHIIEPGSVPGTKDKAIKFCKQQVVKKAIKKIEEITKRGDFEQYNTIEKIIQDALQVGVMDHEIEDVFDNVLMALQADNRRPIPTGIKGIDGLLDGGLGRGELGVVLAPTGTGKTTLLTKFSNEAYNDGYNVVQIFFEDNINNIKRKHFTIWTGVSPKDQPLQADKIEEIVSEKRKQSKGELRLLKLPSDSVTISEIKSKLRKLQADGFRIDLVTLDYVDCITPEKTNYNEEWKGDGAIMRQLESMTSEFDVAIWTATQGNRESIKSEVVTTDQMGGSIKKAQIGHVVLSIGKTIEQKEQNLATLTLLKSRIGKDGVIFNNCKFNNEFLTIDTDYQNTLLGYKEEKEEQKRNRTNTVYQDFLQKTTTTIKN